MAISKSTPYVRYKKDFTSSLHLGTIHIESEYLDRTQKTTIESIHGMTWHNKVVNENKELNLLSDTQLELTELEKQYWNTGEKRASVDEIHTLEEVEPNEDGTYTYTVNSMEGEYIEIYDGINNITSTSDGLDGQFEIVYDTTEEDINGNIALDQVVSQYEITDSGVGTITGAKSTGLTLVNHITEPSKEEVVAIEQQEGEHFTINNTVQGNIKSAILKGQTLVNVVSTWWFADSTKYFGIELNNYKNNQSYMLIMFNVPNNIKRIYIGNSDGSIIWTDYTKNFIKNKNCIMLKITCPSNYDGTSILPHFQYVDDEHPSSINNIECMLIEYQDGMENWDIPYFEGMQSVQMPVLTTTGKNVFDLANSGLREESAYDKSLHSSGFWSFGIQLEPNKDVTISRKNSEGYNLGLTLKIHNENISSGGKWLIANHAQNENKSSATLTTNSDGYIWFIFSNNFDKINRILDMCEYIQIEYGTVATSYEPFKSNILTVNEPVELSGIGEVKDELNLLTGELTQRIGEIVLDDTLSYEHAWNGDRDTETDYVIGVKVNNHLWSVNYEENGSLIKCDKLKTRGISSFSDCGYFLFYVSKSVLGEELTNAKIREYILSLNATVQYPLATESIKTVDLTIQNQNGGTIPYIQTQQGITHVSTSSDGLSPVVEMSCSYDTIIKPNTTYTIKLDRPIVSDTMYLQVDLGGTMMMLDADVNAFTIKTPSTLSHSQLRLSGVGNTVKEIIVLEGNRVNDKIEYFEGMKNVENPILVVSNCPYVFGKGGRL